MAAKNHHNSVSASHRINQMAPHELVIDPPKECIKCFSPNITSQNISGDYECFCRNCGHEWEEKTRLWGVSW